MMTDTSTTESSFIDNKRDRAGRVSMTARVCKQDDPGSGADCDSDVVAASEVFIPTLRGRGEGRGQARHRSADRTSTDKENSRGNQDYRVEINTSHEGRVREVASSEDEVSVVTRVVQCWC